MKVYFRDVLSALFGASCMSLFFGLWLHSEEWIAGAICGMIAWGVVAGSYIEERRKAKDGNLST